MALPVKKPLYYLRDEVRARLGYGGQVANTIQSNIINSILQESQRDIFWEYGFQDTRTTTDLVTVDGTSEYDWPDNVDPNRRVSLQVNIIPSGSPGNAVWVPLNGPGIEWIHDTYATDKTYPLRYDANDKLELWPTPNGVYTVRIEHFPRLGFFDDPPAWTESTNVVVGQYVKVKTGAISYPAILPKTLHKSHFIFECTVAGLTHATIEPTWPIVEGGTVTETSSTVEWTARRADATVPDELILSLGLYRAKAHYNQKDSQQALTAFQNMLRRMKEGSIEGRRFIRIPSTKLSKKKTLFDDFDTGFYNQP